MNNLTQDILDTVSKNIRKKDYEFVVTTGQCVKLQLGYEVSVKESGLYLLQTDNSGDVIDYYELKI